MRWVGPGRPDPGSSRCTDRSAHALQVAKAFVARRRLGKVYVHQADSRTNATCSTGIRRKFQPNQAEPVEQTIKGTQRTGGPTDRLDTGTLQGKTATGTASSPREQPAAERPGEQSTFKGTATGEPVQESPQKPLARNTHRVWTPFRTISMFNRCEYSPGRRCTPARTPEPVRRRRHRSARESERTKKKRQRPEDRTPASKALSDRALGYSRRPAAHGPSRPINLSRSSLE